MDSPINATESALELAAQNGLDLSDFIGSGAGGRVTKADVEALLERGVHSLEWRSVGGQTAEPDAPEPVEPEPVPEALAQIAACKTLAQLLALGLDREQYAQALRERAKEILLAAEA